MSENLTELVETVRSLYEQAPPNVRPVFRAVLDSLQEGAEHFDQLWKRYAEILDAHTGALRRLAFDLSVDDAHTRFTPVELRNRADQIAGHADKLDVLRARTEAQVAEMEDVIRMLSTVH